MMIDNKRQSNHCCIVYFTAVWSNSWKWQHHPVILRSHRSVLLQRDPSVLHNHLPRGYSITAKSHWNTHQSSFTFVCLPVHFLSCSDPVSSSLAQSVMSMASSHSQHSQISTDSLSSMSGSYMAGAEGEEAAETPAESRASSQHEGEVRQLEGLEAGQFVFVFIILFYFCFIVFIFRCFSSCWYYSFTT